MSNLKAAIRAWSTKTNMVVKHIHATGDGLWVGSLGLEPNLPLEMIHPSLIATASILCVGFLCISCLQTPVNILVTLACLAL